MAKESIAGTTLGRISRRMIRMLRAPSVRDAMHEVAVGPHHRLGPGDPGDGRDGEDRQGDVTQIVCSVGDDAPGGAKKATSARARTRPGMASMMLSTEHDAPSSRVRR